MSVWASGVWGAGVWADGVWSETPTVCVWADGVWAEGVWADGVWYCSGAALAPTITTTTLSSGQVGVAYSATLAASGTTPITWAVTVGSLPDGLSLSTGGEITGTPTTDGSYTFTVEATNSEGSDTQELSLLIAEAAVVSDTPSGGWLAYNDAERARRKRKRKELEEAEEAEERARELAALERHLVEEQILAETSEPVDAARLRGLAAVYRDSDLLDKRAKRALAYAERSQTELSYQLALRELQRQAEDEELALIMLLASD